MQCLETAPGRSWLVGGAAAARTCARCALVVALVVTVGCSSSTKPPVDARPADSGGGGGTGGSASIDAAAGTGGADAADGPPADRIRGDGGMPVPCATTIMTNTYDPAQTGCAGSATCRGIIMYVNNTPFTLNYPIITFSVPAGVTCTKTHSSKWIISDDGATSHQCVFTTDLFAMPWNVLPTRSFTFGYDLNDGANPPVPTDITVSDGVCPVPDGGLDAANGDAGDAAATDGTRDGQADQRDGAPQADTADARTDSGN